MTPYETMLSGAPAALAQHDARVAALAEEGRMPMERNDQVRGCPSCDQASLRIDWRHERCPNCGDMDAPYPHCADEPTNRLITTLTAERDAATRRVAELERQLRQVDDAMVLDFIAAKDGDYKSAIYEWLNYNRRLDNDPQVSEEAAAQRAERDQLRAALDAATVALERQSLMCDLCSGSGVVFQGMTGLPSEAPCSRCKDLRAALSAPAVAEARARREALEGEHSVPRMYYIQNIGYCGNCLSWWKVGGHGYTCDLSEAWLVPEQKAKDICSSRPNEDIPYAADLVNSVAVRHVSCEQFRKVIAALETK